MSGERCDLSDLLVSECGCRIHAPVETERKTLSRVFPAQFPGKCAECREPIDVGDRITFVPMMRDGGYVHEECGG